MEKGYKKDGVYGVMTSSVFEMFRSYNLPITGGGGESQSLKHSSVNGLLSVPQQQCPSLDQPHLCLGFFSPLGEQVAPFLLL